ncbi:MAG: substrate-binding periplasmic protein [Candidatus Muiribacteriota bacterium]
MKTIRIFLFLMFVLIFSGSAVNAKEVVLLGDDAYPPYSYSENSKPSGIYVDVIKRIFDRMDGYEVKFKMLPWKRCISNIKKGENIAFFPPYYSKAREDWTVFSEPILKEQTVVFGKEEKLKGKTEWPKDFYNSTFGMNDGFNPETMAGKKFAAAVKLGNIKIDEGRDNETNLKKLVLGRIDFYINDKLIDTSGYPEIKRGIAAKTNWGYLGFTKKDFNFNTYYEDFKIQFNKAVKEIKKTDEIDKIINKYID